ncbi:MAG TPA: site-specific DNA-methyltransferase [Bryobacteraceae bacterium]|nr:site-specific DNA-methyltransferase [Bryobacteraceae bacterium]
MANNKKKAQAVAAGAPAGPSLDKVADYRFPEATRKNNPPAKIAAEGHVPLVPKAEYFYSPRRPPELRFDPTGRTDELPELLATARQRKLTEAEAWALAEALRVHEPWLEWAGKREARSFTVDPVALHIHERVSAQAILKVAAREDVNRSLFADPEQEYNEAVQFYRHDVDWSNRLILGDSLQVMSSLARREDLAGKVQMIYIDPPYGIKFASNFQPEIGKRDVKEKETDLTREPEMVKAYRDTWALGVHSYLAYLRDRLIVARELVSDLGSIFVQIGDQNVHHVREVMDEVFGAQNFMSIITVQKTTSASGEGISTVADFLLWYARNKETAKVRPLYFERSGSGWVNYDYGLSPDGTYRRLTSEERADYGTVENGFSVYRRDNLTSQRPAQGTDLRSYSFCGREYGPGKGTFKTDLMGLNRLRDSDRLEAYGETLSYRRLASDFPYMPISNLWTDTVTGGFAEQRFYVVQTTAKVIGRCLLMTTDPGDLVLDPTCGSGSTAFAAEQWGRRWITIDTSRVAVAIARQRLLTSRFDFYRMKNQGAGIAGGILNKRAPHVRLSDVVRNLNLEPIFAKHEPILEAKLAAAKAALKRVSDKLRNELRTKLALKQKQEGKKAITDADRRRWELPKQWQHWEVPFDTDPDYPADLKRAVEEYRAAWRAKMDEVNACIAANAEQEELVDQPEVDRKITRVSGPFTVEAVQPPEMSLGDAIEVNTGGFAGEPDELGETFVIREVQMGESAQNVEAYLAKMVDLLKMDGVRFPDNKHMKFTRLDAVYASGKAAGIHAEGRWVTMGETDADPEGDATVGVVFGPQYGPITAKMIEEVIKPASRRYDDLVFAGFSFDGPAQAVIDEGHPRLRMHLAHIRPDVNPGMNGLLKEQPGSQLFTVFGRPRTALDGPDSDGMYRLKMEGVDIYDPVTNAIVDTGAAKVAAWFVDGDYDGRTFCITQAFFPDRSAWEKLSKALDGVVDPDRFEAFSGTVSLPFPAGKHRCAAVKVIDPRGNEVMRVHALTPEAN